MYILSLHILQIRLTYQWNYIDRYIDNMSMIDLIEYVANDMDLHLEKLSDSEVISDISFYFEEHFDEIVSEVREGII